jgi:hypothetical protein
LVYYAQTNYISIIRHFLAEKDRFSSTYFPSATIKPIPIYDFYELKLQNQEKYIIVRELFSLKKKQELNVVFDCAAF